MSQALEMLVKRAAESLTFGMDFAPLLDSGELIQTVVGIANDSGGALTVGAGQVVGDVVRFTVSGGATGAVYRFIVTVGTSNGQTREASGLMLIE